MSMDGAPPWDADLLAASLFSKHISDLILIVNITRYPRVIFALFQFGNGRTKYLHITFDFLGLAQAPSRCQGSHAGGDIAAMPSGGRQCLHITASVPDEHARPLDQR